MYLYGKNGEKYKFDYPVDAYEALSKKDENGNQVYFLSEKDIESLNSNTIARLTSENNNEGTNDEKIKGEKTSNEKLKEEEIEDEKLKDEEIINEKTKDEKVEDGKLKEEEIDGEEIKDEKNNDKSLEKNEKMVSKNAK